MKLNGYTVVTGVLGAIILVLAIVLGFVVFPNQVEDKIKTELRLVRGSSVWNKWVDIESPVYTNFYIFHVTNPDDVENTGKVPILQEKGPYVYKQRRQKIDPKVENNKETVRYVQETTYTFDQDRSGNLTEKDLVNVINIPFVSVILAVASFNNSALLGHIANFLLDNHTVYPYPAEKLIRRDVRVGDFLFRGYNASKYFNLPLPPTAPPVQLPPEFFSDTFALYRPRNGTNDGEYEVYTGAPVEQSAKFGEIKKWKGEEMLDPSWWGRDPRCSKLTGTDGSIFRPFLKEDDSITIFSSDLCRLLRFSFKEKVTVKDTKGYRFALPKEQLQGAANNPDNECYCTNKNNLTACQDGVIELSVCKNRAPLVLSTPYWLDGFEGYAKPVGLDGKADRELHETRIDIEPRTGLLLEAHKKIQLNLQVRNIPGVPQLVNVKGTLLFPAMWLDEEASISQVDVDDFKARIEKPIRTVTIVRWVAIGVAGALFIVAVAAFFMCNKKKSKSTV